MAPSKETRVLVEGFRNTRPTILPTRVRESLPAASSDFILSALAISPEISSEERSLIESRSRFIESLLQRLRPGLQPSRRSRDGRRQAVGRISERYRVYS